MIDTSIRRFSVLSLLALSLAGAHGAGYYVSTQGNDSNSGTSSQPFRTITRAYSLAGAGDTITVMPGVYTDYTRNWGLRFGKSGTASNPITLRSQVRGGAVIDGQNGADRNKAIYLDGSYNIIDGFEIRGGPTGGITIWGNYNQILNNDIHRNGNVASSSNYGQDGIYSDRTTRNNIYRGNYIHDNGRTGSNLDHGLYLCGDNELVVNNVMARNASWGLHIAGYNTVSNLKAYNNVMAFNGKGGIMLWLALGGVDIRNNIIYRNTGYGLTSWDAHGSGVVVDRNLTFGNSAGVYNFSNGGSDYSYTLGTTVAAEPLFVNSSLAGLDTHLAAGSPAIAAGQNFSSLFNTDMEGVTRQSSGAWDLGVYKYGVTDTTAPTVSISAPANGATVSGLSVGVSANASDNVGVAGVQFKLNGANLGSEDTSAPYGVTLNTTTLLNGTYTLSAVARDAAGNQATANNVSISVNNLLNSAPTISSIANQSITAGSSTGPLAFTVGDAESAAGSLTVSGSSSNPTLVPGSGIVFGGSGANRTVTVTPAASQTGTATLTVTVSDGSLSRNTSFSLTVNAPAPPPSGLTFASTSGTITSPFVAANGTISQPAYTSLAAGGRAVYSFEIVEAGQYTISTLVDAPSDAANSFFVNIDAEPTDPATTWDIPLTSGLMERTVSWRGNGTHDNSEFTPKVFNLSAGTHQLIVRGREGNCRLGTITLVPMDVSPNDPEGLPQPWQSGDVGTVATAGNAGFDGTSFTVSTSSRDIWHPKDAFHYVYQSWSGDGQIIARVTGVQNTDDWAKAGIMFRNSLDERSAYALMMLTPQNGPGFQSRASDGGSSNYVPGRWAIAPHWLKLTRSGNVFTGSTSTDGVNWTVVHSQTISMSGSILVGLAVTSHNNSVVNTSTFDNVRVDAVLSSAGASQQSVALATVTTPTLEAPRRDAEGNLLLTLHGETGGTFAVESSEDLVHWTPLFNRPNPDGTITFNDTGATEQPHRFYRAMRAR